MIARSSIDNVKDFYVKEKLLNSFSDCMHCKTRRYSGQYWESDLSHLSRDILKYDLGLQQMLKPNLR